MLLQQCISLIETYKSTAKCSFCEEAPKDKRLFKNSRSYLCIECLKLCNGLLSQILGKDWRTGTKNNRLKDLSA